MLGLVEGAFFADVCFSLSSACGFYAHLDQAFHLLVEGAAFISQNDRSQRPRPSWG